MSERAASGAVRFRGGGFAPASSRYSAWLAFAAVLIVWQAVCQWGCGQSAVSAQPGRASR